MIESQEDKATVLIVEDDSALRRQLYWALCDEFRVLEAASRAEAVSALESESVDVALCDLRLPPHQDSAEEGLAVIEAARSLRPPVPVIVITANEDRQSALEAVRRGAHGYFQKPFNEEEIFLFIRQAARVRRLEAENERLRAARDAERQSGFSRFVGSHPLFERALKLARGVADTNATILINGESGTGKELLARAIHEESARRNAPFVAVSCAALSESLIESELFGHEKGAFTDAKQTKKGRFELADGGTLFLDEVGEMSPSTQVKLLRVLQEREFERVGGTRKIAVDVRLIAATNRDLESAVAAGAFRRDLFYRLNVVPLSLPPLRERREDIPVLAAHFAAAFAEKHRRPAVPLDPFFLEALCEYDFPGNVRELQNLIERVVLLQRGGEVDPSLLPEGVARLIAEAKSEGGTIEADDLTGGDEDDEATLFGGIKKFKKRMIRETLRATNDNKAAAAKRLGISRSYLHRLINELGLDA